MKRWFIMLALLLPLLAACGGGGTSTPSNQSGAQATSEGNRAAAGDSQVDKSKLSKELYFYNWSDYIDPDLLTAFEEEYGVHVIMDTYDQNEDMIAKVRAGNSGYDIVVPSDYAVQTLAAEDLIQKLDKSLLPNISHLDPDLLGQYFDKDNSYSVPYMYSITGIAYDTKAFPDGVDSWAALFDPAQLEKVRGKVAMLDDEREVPGAALRYLGKSVNDTDPADLEQIKALLIAQKPYLAAYNSSDTNRKLASGEYLIAHCWGGSAIQARLGLGDEFSGNPDINFVVPKEGGVIWMDSLAILADSPNAYTAHVFINFLLRPDIAARNTEYIGYLTPNKDALTQLPAEVIDLYNSGYAPDAEMLKRLEWIERNEKTTAFTDIWTAVKGE